MVEKVGRRRDYVNTKSFITHNFKKRVRYKGFPLSLDRHEDIRKDFKYLQDFDFQTLQPHESVVLCERYGCSEPSHSLELSTHAFWDYVFRGDWHNADSLRICEGQLLDALMEGLFVATDRGILTTYKMARFDRVPKPVKSCLTGSKIESDMLLLPVKITFTYFSRNEAMSECDFYDPRFAKPRFVADQNSVRKSSSTDSDASNMTNKFMTVWEDLDDRDEIQATYCPTQQFGSSSSGTSRSSSVKCSTASNSITRFSAQESTCGSDDSGSVFSQPTVKTCSSVAQILPNYSDTASDTTPGEVIPVRTPPKTSRRRSSVKPTADTPQTKQPVRNKIVRRPDFSAYAYSSSESESTLRSSTPESVFSRVHFESNVIRRKPVPDRFWLTSVTSQLNLEEDNFKEPSLSKQGFNKTSSDIDSERIRPKLTDATEHLVYSEEERESEDEDVGGKHALMNVGNLTQALKLSKAYRDQSAGNIVRESSIPQHVARIIRSTVHRQSNKRDKPVDKLLFVKYGDSLTRGTTSGPTATTIDRKNYTIKPSDNLQTYDRQRLRQCEYFNRVVMSKLYGKCSSTSLPYVNPEQPPEEQKPAFQTNRLKISHSITRMRLIERNKEIRKSIRPMAKKFQKCAEVVERFIRGTHLPNLEKRMKKRLKMTTTSKQGWSTRFIQTVEDNSTDSLVRQARQIFHGKLPDDFYANLLTATSKFLIRKEQVTLSNQWRTVTTVTICRRF